ncbi:MAG: RNA methyltransferase [Oscillospiraceae bacterium]|nr:RNA methyltransferase [Oscillospiraceae bacterium]
MINITSKDNKILKHTKKLWRSSYRAKSGEFVAEGERLCAEALTYGKPQISYAILTDEFVRQNVNFQKKLDDLGVCVYTVSEKLFSMVSQTTTPQGVLLVIRIPDGKAPNFADLSRVLILDGINEPGNMGTIIRTADAFGFSTIVLCNSCVDIYNPKVVRSSMGGIFRTKFINAPNVSETIESIKNAEFQVVATAIEEAVDINTVHFTEKCALIIGNEASGVSDELLTLSDKKVKIPMANETESLNAAVAAGIAMFKGWSDINGK